MDDVDGLLEEMASWLTKGDESLSWSVHLRPHMLRLMAHLALFFRRTGRASCDDLIGLILEAYVRLRPLKAPFNWYRWIRYLY